MKLQKAKGGTPASEKEGTKLHGKILDKTWQVESLLIFSYDFEKYVSLKRKERKREPTKNINAISRVLE